MTHPTLFTTTTLTLQKSVTRSPLRHGFLVITLTCFALSPTARAVSPAPDGGYPNGNTAEGDSALAVLTTGEDNTAIGFEALSANTVGASNTAIGFQALFSNVNGQNNTATGLDALAVNNGSRNTADGAAALNNNVSGGQNTATGFLALFSNTSGGNNTATGVGALFNNIGATAGGNRDAGSDNTATGVSALYSNNTGFFNTADGFRALYSNNTGYENTASGYHALDSNTTGVNNIALGYLAGHNLTTGSNNIEIGALGVAGEANTIRIGKAGVQKTAYMQGISGATVASGVAVIVGSNGQLGTIVSSARFKDPIKPMDKASEAILALKPVTFHYKKELDPDGIPQFGLVAEQVEKVNPDLVARDADGKAYTVRYEAVNAMLLNEFLKQHNKVQTLEATVTKQQRQIEALTAGLRKVSAQVEMNEPAPQIVADNQ